MREYLVFLLAAPMASFGSYAGYERRSSELVPLRSAILGLVGAALGIDRGDVGGQNALRKYSVAVQSFQRSAPLRDYHTVQTVPTARARQPTTRKQALELAGPDANTIITRRDYRCDVLIGAVLWGDSRWALQELALYLRRPHFPLYLGRKSCPLASPLNASVVQATGPVEALSFVDVPAWLRPARWSERDQVKQPVYSDPLDGSARALSSERVPGEPLDRRTWTFGECTVWHLVDHQDEQGREGKE